MGNQSDKGLQILVTTPLFCYWIFGTMNLSSGYLVYRQNNAHLNRTSKAITNSYLFQNHNQQQKQHFYYQQQQHNLTSISGIFLFVYCLPYTILLLAVIYEFANIDVWLNASPFLNRNTLKNSIIESTTPMWPFLTRIFMELILGVICSIWILGPRISSICYKNQRKGKTIAKKNPSRSVDNYAIDGTSIGNRNCSLTIKSGSAITTAYQSTIRPLTALPYSSSQIPLNSSISLNPVRATRSLQRVGQFTRIMYPSPAKVHIKRQGSPIDRLGRNIITSCDTETIL